MSLACNGAAVGYLESAVHYRHSRGGDAGISQHACVWRCGHLCHIAVGKLHGVVAGLGKFIKMRVFATFIAAWNRIYRAAHKGDFHTSARPVGIAAGMVE